MAILIFLFVLLFLLYSLTAINFSLQALKYSPRSPVEVDEECQRDFIRDSWIYGIVSSNSSCPPLQNDYLVERNKLFVRDVVSGDDCCSFSLSTRMVNEPRILAADTIAIFTQQQLNEKPYIISSNGRTYTPACVPCCPLTSVILSHLEGNRYLVQNDRALEVELDMNNFRPTLVIRVSGDLPVIEAETRNNILIPSIAEVSPTTEKIISIANRSGVYFQPLPLP